MMKYTLAVLVCTLWSFVSYETSEGVITYTTKVNMHKRLTAEREHMKQMLPEFNITKNALLFQESESLYKTLPKEENPFEQGQGRGGSRMVINTPMSNETYLDRVESRVIELKEFMGKKYLIKKELNRIPWKLEAETKEIQGYVCKSASYVDEKEREIKAWYTEEIRIPLGPENFQGLPGLILEVAINDDDILITTEKIEWRTLKKNEIKVPKSGQEVTEEEYQALVKEQINSMGGFRMDRN